MRMSLRTGVRLESWNAVAMATMPGAGAVPRQVRPSQGATGNALPPTAEIGSANVYY
jgi:hypothetical protein